MQDKSTNWKLWCTDKFGRSNDTYICTQGDDLENGLKQFWVKELTQGHHKNGSRSWNYYALEFSSGNERGRIKTDENKEMIAKLVEWSTTDLESVTTKLSMLHFDSLKKHKDIKTAYSELSNSILNLNSINEFLMLTI